MPVTLSINNFTIYQDDNGVPILRQSIPGNPSKVFSLSNDNRTIHINVLESTFNKPNANYYIVIDDNAVKDLISNQPLAGVGKNYWNFETSRYLILKVNIYCNKYFILFLFIYLFF